MSKAFFFPNPRRLATAASLFWMAIYPPEVRIAVAQSTQELLWSDEFDQAGEPDASVWNIRTGGGGWGNGELQIYNASAVTVSEEGDLLITASRNQDANEDEFVSGRVDTAGKLQAQYGTFKARIQIQNSLDSGLWPAFWTLGSDFTTVEWPRSGEINIMEMGSGSAIADGVVDQRVVSGAHWEVNDTYTTSAGFLDASDSLVSTSTYHIYKLDWTPTTLTTYLDDVQIWSLNIDRTTCQDCEEFHKPHYMVLNLAVGGGFTSGTCGTSTSSSSSSSAGICEPLRTADEITASLPATIAIDWIRIYDNGHTILTTVPIPRNDPTAPSSATPDSLTDSPASTEPSTLDPVQGDDSGSGGGGGDFIGGGGGGSGGTSGKGSKSSKSSKSSKGSRSSSTESDLQFASRGHRRHTRGASAAAVITAYGIAQLVG